MESTTPTEIPTLERQPAPGHAASRWPAAAMGVILLTLGAASGALVMFSQFRDYDDEGYMMMAVRQFLDGRTLYDQIPNPYGPAYYLYKWLLHGLLNIPLTHDATRISAAALWLVAAGALAAVVAWIWRRSAFGIGVASLGFAAALLHLKGLTNEPGHPQELAVALVGLGLLAACLAGRKFGARGALLLGCAGGLLLAVKLNVGVLFLAASAASLAFACPKGLLYAALRWTIAAAVLLMPAVLLHRHLAEGWAQQFGLVTTLALLGCLLICLTQRSEVLRPAMLFWWAGGTLVAAALPAGFILLRGSSAGGMVDCLFLRAIHFPDAFCVPIRGTGAGLAYAATGVGLAGVFFISTGRLRTTLEHAAIPALKAILAIAILARCAGLSILPGIALAWHFEFALGFVWLTMVVPPSREAAAREVFARQLLALVAVLQVLQMYPVPGTQALVGTAALPAIAAVWLGDVICGLGQRMPAGLLPMIRKTAPAPALLAILVLGWYALDARRSYARADRAELAGAQWVRMREDQAAVYRCLAETARASADAIACNIGLNSLSFWSGRPPASTLLVGYTWDFLTDAEQQAVAMQAATHPRLLYIDRPWIFGAPKARPPLMDYAQRELRYAGRVGAYRLHVRPGQALSLRSCAWPAPGELQLDIRPKGADAPGPAAFTILELALPLELPGQQISGIELVDLARHRVLARTHINRTDKLVLLLDFRNQVLLGDEGRQSPVTPRTHSGNWRVAIPAPIDLEQCAIPAVRFYRGKMRVATLPVVSPAE